MKKIIAVAIAVLLSACGSGLDGTYKDQMGVSSYTFKSGKVKIVSPQGTMVMNILKDGSIEGPIGIKLTKQKE